VTIVSNPVNGTAVANVDGTVTYTPGSGFGGIDSFSYTVNDDLGAVSNAATVTVMTQDTLFFDLFSDASSANDWTVVDEGTGVSAWNVVGGAFQQSQSIFSRTALDETFHLGAYAAFQPGASLTDYQFSIDAQMLQSEAGEDIGVMFRYQDTNNYYRLSLNSRHGYARFEKKVGGVFETLAVDARGYQKGQLLRLRVVMIGSDFHVYLNGDAVFSVNDNSLNYGTIALYCGDQTQFDNVLIASVGDKPFITLAAPLSYSVTTGNNLNVTAIASNIPANAEVEFLLDGTVSQTATFTPPSTFTGEFTGVAAGNHSVEALLKDASMVEVAHDFNETVGVSGAYLLAIGDSNINGSGDNYTIDNSSVHGHVIGFQGLAGPLTDLLNLNGPFANNIVYNEAIGGDESADTATSRMNSILMRHPGADKSLVLLGTNDALSLIPPGSGCSGTGCDGSFQRNMQDLIDRNLADGKEVWVAQAPPIFGSGGTPFASPSSATVNTDYIQVYNSIIVNELTGIQIGPDFFTYYLGSGQNRFSLFSDFLHFNALGHKIAAYLWYNAMNPAATLPLPFIVDNLALSTQAPFLKQNLLEVGDNYYVDEDFRIHSIPDMLKDGVWIMTANADRGNTTSSYVSFDVDRSVTVYVAFDVGASSRPPWLADYTDSGQIIGVTDPSSPQLRVYSRSYPTTAGNITLGGNHEGADNGADSNYIVVVVPN
jgi:lysophospholipase L1-like esterase